MMTNCLKRVYRGPKPGRWVTVEFHNSQNAVWTAIQEALGRAGFIIADVSVLDKGMKTKKQLSAKAVDKDLVISGLQTEQRPGAAFRARSRHGIWPMGLDPDALTAATRFRYQERPWPDHHRASTSPSL